MRVTVCSGTGSGVIFRIIVDIGPSRTPQVAPSSAHCCQYCEAENLDFRCPVQPTWAHELAITWSAAAW